MYVMRNREEKLGKIWIFHVEKVDLWLRFERKLYMDGPIRKVVKRHLADPRIRPFEHFLKGGIGENL
jgi:hypothetical protein